MKIVTIIPIDGHLDKKFFGKDILQIGQTFIKYKKFESEFWTISKNYNCFIYKGQKWIGYKNLLSIILNIILKSRKIELLHLYGIKRDTLLIMFLYKIFNSKGKVYVKTDMPLYKNGVDSRIILDKLPNFLLWTFVFLVDYLGLENKELISYFKNKYKKYVNKFLFLPCGAVYIDSFVGIRKKENTISLCGRFGAKEKNFELFIEMLKNNDISFLKGWKVNFIGEMTNEYEKKIKSIIGDKPILKDIILIRGFKNEKNDLYELLIKSKLLILTSNSEGEPNVQFDSMFCGNYIISTNVGTIKQNYPKNYSKFYEINNNLDLYEKLKSFILNKDKKLNIKDYQSIQNYCIKNYIWEKSLSSLLKKF